MGKLETLIGSTKEYYPKSAEYDEYCDSIRYWNKMQLYINYKIKNGNTYCYLTTYEDKTGNLVSMPISASSIKVHSTTTPPVEPPKQMTIFDFI